MADDNLPSEKAAAKAANKAAIETKLQENRERLQGAMRRVFSSSDGQIVLKWLHDESGYGRPVLGANPSTGEIDPMRTTYSAMQQGLYLRIRKFLTLNILKGIEYDE
jgi:hypothetical protein